MYAMPSLGWFMEIYFDRWTVGWFNSETDGKIMRQTEKGAEKQRDRQNGQTD